MPKPISENYSSEANSSGLITWSGDCIPCLGIKTGDNLNAVVHTIAEKVCEALEPYDLSTLTLQGALDVFDNEEVGTRTLVKVLQLLADNDSGLKELIDNIQNQIDGIGGDALVLDLKCLKEVDGFGNQIPYTNQTVLQSLLNEVCDLDDRLTDLSGKYITLKNNFDNLDIPDGNEAEITTCISGPKAVSEALVDVAEDYCDYKEVLGTVAQIQTALGRQTAAMNTLMSSVSGWITTPSTGAQWLSNIGLLLTNLMGRVAANEACCESGCDVVRIGFLTSFDGNTVILQFTSGAGTFIPDGYFDCGSELTISDGKGNSIEVDISISQSGETPSIDLSAFTAGDVLSFNIDAKLCSETNTCQQCVNKDVKYVNDSCCILTNTSSSSITITYSTPATSTSNL